MNKWWCQLGSGECLRDGGRYGVFADKTVWSIYERLRGCFMIRCYMDAHPDLFLPFIQTCWSTANLSTISSGRHNKPRAVPHCRVLPPGEFNGTIAELLVVYSESCMSVDVTIATTFVIINRGYRGHTLISQNLPLHIHLQNDSY